MRRITIARGDGIGPEIMEATLSILKAAGAELEYDEIEIGEKVYLSGNSAGIAPAAWDIIRRNKIFLKSPITTPQGGGYKSLNVSTRKFLGLYSNVRPCRSLHPFVSTKHPVMDLVIIRENEEDLYAGIEHQQTDEVVQCLKLISRPGCEKIIRYAFEYAKQQNRKKVTCFSKDNIMKQTDGLFHQVFNEIAAEYPEIQNEHWIVDIGAAMLADTPEAFDVIVMQNLYGDMLSDVAAQITGMLNHIGQSAVAAQIQNAWLKTLEDGIHTPDIYKEGVTKQKVGTQEFAAAVIENLGKKSTVLKSVSYAADAKMNLPKYVPKPPANKELDGVDIFIHWRGGTPDQLAQLIKKIELADIHLSMITNRGIKVWPEGFPETFCTDHWRCRFKPIAGAKLDKKQIIQLLENAIAQDIDVIKTENLYTFDGVPRYSLGQGQ